ncbi:hypothetical protein DSECCO2_420710 [anaerobic digester metagenome]|jgi:hypothetical protein|uniref:Uncharacterized protein n=1 Tax=Methanobacterium subterraneum TaxID=59277 RepID=A0A2H4VSX1_9EURY|nr:nitrophenyl compound nitroreductase subunit ArsF family protein [Methanobacterium subterraneum]AUB61205.1 hypothetical protein BK009_11310 [Methanobacterium subterraneum]
MNKNHIYISIVAIIALLLIFFIPRYLSVSNTPEDITSTNVSTETVKNIEVIHFHGTAQCDSCIRVGDLAEETINENFENEIKSGKITFKHINAELPENAAIVEEYGVKSASLWLGINSTSRFRTEEIVQVWYKTDNPSEYKSYLTELLKKRLNGETK